MSVKLIVVPSNSQGEPIKSALVKCWYVMEGDHVHCCCPNPELAELMIEEMKNSLSIDKLLATLELFTEKVSPAGHYDIHISSRWANTARFNVKRKLDKKNTAKAGNNSNSNNNGNKI